MISVLYCLAMKVTCKLDSIVYHTDGCIVSGSEDGRICFWDLVEVIVMKYDLVV